jgi:hypothetical protein
MIKANSFLLNGKKIRAKCFRVNVKGTKVIIYRHDRKFKVVIDGEPFPISPIYEQFEFSAHIVAMDHIQNRASSRGAPRTAYGRLGLR